MTSASSHLIGRWLPRQRPAADHLPAYQALMHKPASSSFHSSHAATAAAFTTSIACESPAAGLVVAPVAMAVVLGADVGEVPPVRTPLRIAGSMSSGPGPGVKSAVWTAAS